MDLYSAQLEAGKFQCRVLNPNGICAKLFKTREHLAKHIHNKHAPVVAAASGGRAAHVRLPTHPGGLL